MRWKYDQRELLSWALAGLAAAAVCVWAFPRAFPWFTENKYWEEHVLTLREQRAALDDPLHVQA